MSQLDHTLKRLLQAAARAPGKEPAPTPFALEAPTLAHWRSSASREDPALLTVLFRRAAVCAVLIMALSIGWNWLGNRNNAAGVTALTNYEARMQWVP